MSFYDKDDIMSEIYEWEEELERLDKDETEERENIKRRIENLKLALIDDDE